MLRRTATARVQYRPYALHLQTRFQPRSRPGTGWDRLMDASCFVVDWQTRTRLPELSELGGHWSHVVTAAHVVVPWDYPHFFPPTGPTRFISELSLADTRAHVRFPSLEGEYGEDLRLSNRDHFTHGSLFHNTAALHCRVDRHRADEPILLDWQTRGVNTRPRLELLEELKEGDDVWVHGVSVVDDATDEEQRAEPRAVPTARKGRVASLRDQHFFVDVDGDVPPGLCGAPVIRGGKCVGMLTSTVHRTSAHECKGAAVCTYAHDIRQFLLNVEQQLKNPPRPGHDEDGDAKPMARRHAEGTDPLGRPARPHVDYQRVPWRLARRVPCPTLPEDEEGDGVAAVNQNLWES